MSFESQSSSESVEVVSEAVKVEIVGNLIRTSELFYSHSDYPGVGN